jgi:hypothetical protein
LKQKAGLAVAGAKHCRYCTWIRVVNKIALQQGWMHGSSPKIEHTADDVAGGNDLGAVAETEGHDGCLRLDHVY